MKENTERRDSQRCSQQVSVTCAYFNWDKFYHAKSTNHSKEGINFFSDFPLRPGSSIHVRIDSNAPEGRLIDICDCRRVRTIGLAEVKWCRKISDEYGAFYSIGLKYHEPAV